MKKQALDTITEMYAHPEFHFGVNSIGEKEELYIRGYIAAVLELGVIEFEEMYAFLESIGKDKKNS